MMASPPTGDDENMGDEAPSAYPAGFPQPEAGGRDVCRRNADAIRPVKFASAQQLFRRLLTIIGEDPDRPGLQETPKRATKAWTDWTAGYHQNPEAVLKVFEDGAELCGDEMVIVKDIEIYSHCEHHLAPFFGCVHIAYIPNGKVVGLSKLARLADVFAKRLQVQERLTNQIANALVDHLQPLGVGVIVEAKHFCMCSRGVGKQGSTTITSALRGAIKDKPEARAEFMSLIRG